MDKEKESIIRDMEMALRVALSAVRPDLHLSAKSMFGGAGFFADGQMFAAWFGVRPEVTQDLRREFEATL